MPSTPIRAAETSFPFVSDVELVVLEDRVLYDASPLVACAQDILESVTADEDYNGVSADATAIPAFDTGFVASVVESFDEFSTEPVDVETVPTKARQLVVIDGQVGDVDSLVEDIRAQNSDGSAFDISILSKEADGIQQITEILDGREQYDAIHIISHGSDGQLQLGNSSVNSKNLNDYESYLSRWTTGLAFGGDVLLYGCDLAGSFEGKGFVDQLGDFINRDIAASEDLTGHRGLGGDWTLEYEAGEIESRLVFTEQLVDEWKNTLESLQLTSEKDTYISKVSANTSFGAEETLQVSKSGNDIGNIRALIEFDLGAIPDNVTINSASLILKSIESQSNFGIELFSVANPWELDAVGQGTTWTERIVGVNWDSAGGDYTSGAIAYSDPALLYSWDVTNLLSDWLTGTKANYGVLLGSSLTGNGTVTFDSSEGGTAPVLEIDYTPNNNAPALDNSGDMFLPDIFEDSLDPVGSSVAELIASAGGDRISDADVGAVEGIAIVAADQTNGNWQFDVGNGWVNLESVSVNNAVVLDATALVRFVPSTDYFGPSGDFVFHAWDQTDGHLSGTIGVSVAETGGASSFSVASESVSHAVLPVNDVPVITGIETTTLEFIEGLQGISVSSTITLADVDNTQLQSATVAVKNNYEANSDVLMFSGFNDITGSWDSLTGILTLSGVDSVENYQAALRTVEFRNTSERPTAETRSIEFSVSDGEADSITQSRSVSVIPTNDPPTMNYFSGDSLVSLNDGEARILDASVAVSIYDPDLTTDFNGGRLIVEGIGFAAEDALGIEEDSAVFLSNGLAVGSLVSVQGLSIGELVGVSSSAIMVEFNSAATTGNVATLIHNISFATTSTEFGMRVVEFELNDSDGTLNGGVDTSYGALNVFVTDQNEGYVSTLEDTAYSFSSSDFDFTGFVGDLIDSITITSLPSEGVLLLEGAPVQIGDVVSKIQIDSQSFEFIPANDGSGGLYASFDFFVNNGILSINVLAGEPGFRSLGSEFFSNAEAILGESDNFGPGGVVSSSIVIGGPSNSIDADYLSQGEIYFGGMIDDGRLTAAELNAIDQWVLGGGVLISTGEQPSTDDLNSYYGLTTQDAGTTWVVSDDDNPIMNGVFGTVGQIDDTFPAYAITASFDPASLMPGDLVLAIDQQSGNPTMVLRSHGNGKILFTGDTGIFYSDLTGGGAVVTPNDILTANVFAWAIDEANVEPELKCMQVGVVPVNDAPVIESGDGEPLIYRENDGLVAVWDSIVISDVDDIQIESATISISSNYNAGEDRLDFFNNEQSSILGIWDSGSGTLELTGIDSVENYQLALRSVTYQNTSDSPVSVNRLISFQVNDGELLSEIVHQEIQVVPVNDAPTDLFLSNSTVDENTDTNSGSTGEPFIVGQLSNNDPDIGDTPRYAVIGGLDQALFQIGGLSGDQLILEDGILDYERQASYEVVLRVSDQFGAFFDKSFLISVQNQNESPTEIFPNDIFIAENTDTTDGVSLGVLSSVDQDLGDQFTYAVVSGDDAGYFAIGGANSDELVIQGALLDFEIKSQYECVVRSTDTLGLFVDQLILVSLIDFNEAPEFLNQGFSIDENSPLGTTVGVLSAVDADADDVLSFNVTGGSGVGIFNVNEVTGEVIVADDVLLNYETTPVLNLLIDVVDREGLTESAEVLIELNDVNDEQELIENSILTVIEGSSAVIDASLLRTVDEEQSDDRLVYSIVKAPLNGTLEVAGVTASQFTQDDINQGRVNYVHNGAESLSDSFEFLVDDGVGGETGGVFVIAVTPVNDAPVAEDDFFTINEGASFSASGEQLLGNDFDPDSSEIGVRLVDAPVNGTVALNSDGSFTYTHDGSETLQDRFTYQLDDGSLSSSIANVEIQVNPVNDAPIGGVDEYSVTTGRVLSAFQSVLANDLDVEGNSIVALLVDPPSNGTVLLNPNGSFVYVPNAGFFGVDTFTYMPSDGAAEGVVTTVTIQVEVAAGAATTNPLTNVDQQADETDENNEEYLGVADAIAARRERRSLQREEDAVYQETFTKFVPEPIEEYVSLISDRNRAAEVLRILVQNPASEMVVEESEIRNLELNSIVGISMNTEYLIDQLQEADRYETSLEDIKMTVGALTTLGTLGYVFWTLRGSALMALALAQLPSWQMIDPLPVLESYSSKNGEKKQDEVDGFFN